MIAPLVCSINGSDITLDLAHPSRLADLHGGAAPVVERATCNYGLNPELDSIATVGGMRVAARDDLGEIRAVELEAHPFFVATLYQPQLRSSAGEPHPIFVGFLRAAAEQTTARR